MDKTALVDIEGGERLLKALDEAELDVHAALWLYLPDPDEWRFIVALPLVDQEGPKKAYIVIQSVLTKLEPPPRISLEDISVVSPKHDLIRTLRLAISTGPGRKNIELSNVNINNLFFEAAHIYRIL